MPIPRTRASWYSRQALKSMSSAPSCEQHQAGRVLRQVGGGQLVRQVPGLLGGTGHWPSRLVLSLPSATAPLMDELVARQVAVGRRGRSS